MIMYRGKEKANYHASQMQTMINRGWSCSAPVKKTKESNH